MNKTEAPNLSAFRDALQSRNTGLLCDLDYGKIRNTRILIAGCGVGSQIAVSAARMGFENFVIVDGDKIEISNVNRQEYSWRDAGRFKVDALARKIKAINPHCKIKKFPLFVDTENAGRLVELADIVVDSIDPQAPLAIVALHRAARSQDKHVVLPLDVGWGARVYVFNGSSISYDNMIGISEKTPLEELNPDEILEKFVLHFISDSPDYVKEITQKVMSGEIAHYPQPITAANTLSAMSVIAFKKICLQEPIKLAPKYVSYDPDLNFSHD